MNTANRAMAAVAAGFVADALWRRSRAGRLRTLPPSDAPVAPTHRFVTAAGVEPDEATRRAASAYARSEGLGVLDLVPADLDAARVLELVRRLDPRTYRHARLAQGEGACHALLVDEELIDRAAVTDSEGLSAAEMDALTARLKRYCPTTTDLVVAPDLPAVSATPEDRRRILRRRWLHDLPTYLAGNLLGLGALGGLGVAAVVSGRHGGAFGCAMLAAAGAQPYLATVGTPLHPRDRHRFAASRPLAAPYRWARVAAVRERRDPIPAWSREEYAAELAHGVERFYQPCRDTCPWCGRDELRHLLTSDDMQHHRPGVFRLDRCGDCGHVFQNPRLSQAGLDFHYRDFYDGDGGPEVERGFRLGAPHYRDRARMLRGHAVPVAWLDVGGGHGHFCNAARDIWPDARFDALDMGAGIEEAQRQGWVDFAHRGFFTELTDKLVGAYDVVSMHHYLEHTPDPRAELDAAATVLPLGGHLLIEVPDPQWPVGRIAGRWWHCWFQPQHLNMVPIGNMVEALDERGLRTVAVQRGPAHQPLDLTMIAMLMVHRVVPDPDKPWRTAGHRRLRVAARTAAFLTGGPVIVGAAMLDQLLYPIIRRSGRSNAYRVLATRVR